MKDILLVFAGDKREFDYFIDHIPEDFKDKFDFKYVSSESKAFGYAYDPFFITYGSWYKHDWIYRVITKLNHNISTLVFHWGI